MRPQIIGTAGHIDHGKTALVRALTGTQTDRLKEEIKRGITIELGYAFLTEKIAIIDVPGHEKFIKNMVAGVATVDFALLVVAADDGLMPQTREHFDILKLLGLKNGMVAITKCDVVDDEWVDMVEEDVSEMVKDSFLAGKPVVRVDSLSGRGIDELKNTILRTIGELRKVSKGLFFRLPVDRVFTIKGFGTVVTGSALSGAVALEDKLVVLPAGNTVRVRGLESQGNIVEQARAGMRVAVNLAGVSKEDVSRGDVLVTPSSIKSTRLLNAECEILPSSPIPLKQRQRIRLHIGTKEVMGTAVLIGANKILPGDKGFVQFKLEEPVAVQRLDRYVIRRYSPQITIGGGSILDANPGWYRKKAEKETICLLKNLGDVSSATLVYQIVGKAGVITIDELAVKSGLQADEIKNEVEALILDSQIISFKARGKEHLIGHGTYLEFEAAVKKKLDKYHAANPLAGGIKLGELAGSLGGKLPDFAVKHLMEKARALQVIKFPRPELVCLYDFEIRMTKKQKTIADLTKKILEEKKFSPPGIKDMCQLLKSDEKTVKQVLQFLTDSGEVVNLEGKIYFAGSAIKEGLSLLVKQFQKNDSLTMSEFRKLLDTSRKYALPLLNYYDSIQITVRDGDVRKPGKKI